MIHHDTSKNGGGAAAPSKCQKFVKQIIKNYQKGAGSVAGGQPDPRAGSRDAGAGGIPFLINFDDLFDDFLALAWGGSPPPPFFDVS